MATGKSKGERRGKETVIVHPAFEEPLPLPTADSFVAFTYANKASLNQLESLPKPRLKIEKKYGGISENALYLSDNLRALRAMLDTHRGKVKLVYLDPPYNTGFEFHSRNLQHAYDDRRNLSAYLEWIRRRLILCRELLAPDGSLYLHIGHQMLFHLKVVLDEIFGTKCFRNLIVRKKCSSKNYTKLQYPNLHDYVLFYTKSDSAVWNKPGTIPDTEWIAKEYTKRDAKGQYKLVPIHAPGPRNGETGTAWRGKLPPPGKHWQVSPAKLEELDRRGEMYWSKNGNPRRKVYLVNNKTIPVTDYWERFRDAHHQSIEITGYPTEKNLEMMKMIIEASSNPGDIVLDPFCGSGTTLQAAAECGRKWIGLDSSFEAIKTSVGRLVSGSSPMGDFVKKQADTLFDLHEFSSRRPKTQNSFELIVADEVLTNWRQWMRQPELKTPERQPVVG